MQILLFLQNCDAKIHEKWDTAKQKCIFLLFFERFSWKNLVESNKSTTFAPANENSCLFILVGAIAQLVEQRTENPCVPGSIPGGTTSY